MQSNTDLLKEELTKLKHGHIQKTASEIAVKFGRNRRHIIDGMKHLQDAGIIEVSELAYWKML